jgi:hypothetical protein
MRFRHLLFRPILNCALILAPSFSAASLNGCYPITFSDALSKGAPKFAQYPVQHSQGSKAAAVVLTSHPLARRYRTKLRRQAVTGPNFAGHYTIAGWGCGASCLQFAVIDSKTGRVFFPNNIPSVVTTHVDTDPNEPTPQFFGLRYHLDSRLLIVLGARDDDPSLEGITYYRWDGSKFREIKIIQSNKHDCEDS